MKTDLSVVARNIELFCNVKAVPFKDYIMVNVKDIDCRIFMHITDGVLLIVLENNSQSVLDKLQTHIENIIKVYNFFTVKAISFN